MRACYPKKHRVSELLLDADKRYQAGDLDRAHAGYFEAFHINPYDQRVISSLALTFYKKGMACESAQVAWFGMGLENGNQATRASILYNFAVAARSLGWLDQYRDALERSNEIKPSEHKSKLLAGKTEAREVQNCNRDAQWIRDIEQSIETQAVVRSRG